ncbi:Ig-like domain-containing protein [Microvirga arabica]|uniref:Ig-like domain-containing protein n=1 Tax=Microvirga arabica TaxID=1128671 RepID=UPI00193A43D5|nr:hypothetical protein [Microvirga arabica]MBM1174999.1 hypothetical protein [Microvirga arabica]
MAFTVLRSGDEQQVNTLIKNSQSHPTITRLTDGGWVVTWSGQDASGNGIYMQRYDANGVAQFTSGGVPADRLVNTSIEGNQIWSTVVGLSNGGWVVSWIDRSNDTGVIHQRHYNSAGEPQDVTTVNPSRLADTRSNIEMTALADGEWLVTWQSGDGSNYGIYQQRFNAQGEPQIAHADQRVNVKIDGHQRFSDVTTLQDGGWIVSWVDEGPYDLKANIYMRRYDKDGRAVALDGTAGSQEYAVVTDVRGMGGKSQKIAALPNGGWLVVRYGVGPDGSNDIFFKRYDASGVVRQEEIVNVDREASQDNPHIAVHDDGSWVITWESRFDVHQRRYLADGSTSGPDLVVPAWLGSIWNEHPQVTALDNERWVVTWQTLDQDEKPGTGIAQRIFTQIAVDAVTSALEYATGTTDDDVLNVEQNGLSVGDVLDGGGGNDTLQMTQSGAIDLTLPAQLLRFERIVGTNEDDRIIASAGRITQFETIDGGGGNNDVLELVYGGNYDLSDVTLMGIDWIKLSVAYSDYHVTVDDVATALLIDGSESFGETVELTDGVFTQDELIRLFSQGIDVVRYGGADHTNALPQIANFFGDQSKALIGGAMTRLDTDGAAVVSDDLNRFQSLSVQITNRVAGEDRLGLIQENGVTVANGRVFFNNALVGTLAKDGSGTDGLLINFDASATSAMVTAVVQALAYQNTASGSYVAQQRQIAVLLTDAGGAQSFFDLQVNLALSTGGQVNRAPVIEGVPTKTETVADTSFISPFASIVLSDPDGDRLTVTVTFDKTKGVLIPGGGGTYDPQEGTYTVEGTGDYVRLALNALQFNPTDRNGPVGLGEETTFTITVADDESQKAEAQVTVRSEIADRPPSRPTLSNNRIDELVADGTPVGTLSAQDSNGQTIAYSLVGAGDAPFEIVGSELRVKNGVALDYEQTTSYTFTIRTSAGGLSNDRVVTISVNDVGVESTAGSVANDVIKGGVGKDTLGGGLGDDKLFGGLGNDTLKGDGGKDIFVFATKTNKKTNVDKISDFVVKDDSIWLDNAVFTKIGKGSEDKPGKLAKAMFWTGKEAHDASDRIIYDKKSGALYYDADGTGRSAQVKFATLKKGLSLTEKDFFVI